MAKINKSSIKDQVYNIVRHRIFDGKYTYGETISILGLSQELEVSNTPIREALNMLTAEGLLTTSHNNKFRVFEPNDQTMTELNEMVSILLIGGYRIVHRRNLDQELVQILRDALKKQEKTLKDGEQDAYIQAAMEFDRSFAVVSGNKELLTTFDNYNTLLHLYVKHAYWKDKDTVMKKLEEHKEMIAAVEKGDVNGVVELIEQHFDEHYELV